MERLNTFLLLCMMAAIFIIVLNLGPSSKENMSQLTYLKQYEMQDWYRENPSIWPISAIPPTVEYEAIREQNKNR
jgi:hypothetical protein